MEILISICAKVAEYTVAPIGRQMGYLIFYKANFEKLTDHVNDLESKRDEITHHVEEERRNGKEIETSVQTWLDNVDGVIAEANQLQKDPRRAKVGCSRWSFPNLVSRHQLSRKATKTAEHVVEVQGRGNFDRVAYLPVLDVALTSAIRGSENFESRKSIKENIMHALRDPKVSMIGVYGLGGVGKTTLVKEVSEIAKQDKLFDAVVMATLSKTPNLRTIQGEIADQLGLRFEEETVTGREPRLRHRIKMEKTILIILDDIWERLDLEKLGIPFKSEHNSCKMLMTSRNSDLLRQMGVKKHFRLEALNEEETWSLFKVMAGDVDEEPTLRQIASQVAKKCAGLPILIVTVARSLIGQDIHVWKDALNQLKRSDNKEMQEIAYSALELTYYRLQGNEMKTLFLLCATNVEMPFVSDLFKYGMGLGIFNSTDTMQGARDRFYNMISALKASCLLLEDDTSTRVKMHDVVREVAISIAARDQYVLTKIGDELKEFPSMDFLARCSQIILKFIHISKLPEKLDCPNLKLFYLHAVDIFLEIPDSFFERMKSLEVLDLSGMILNLLPTSFLSLNKLKTLCLDQCVLENIDAVGALENLEIRSLMESSMTNL